MYILTDYHRPANCPLTMVYESRVHAHHGTRQKIVSRSTRHFFQAYACLLAGRRNVAGPGGITNRDGQRIGLTGRQFLDSKVVQL